MALSGVRVIRAEVWPVQRYWGASQGLRKGREVAGGGGVREVMGRVRQGPVAIRRALAFAQSGTGATGGS